MKNFRFTLMAALCILIAAFMGAFLDGCASLPERYSACAAACDNGGGLQRFDATTDSCACYKKLKEME